jgi:site-specific DNA-methyltransferase (adenine-specific)
MRLSRSFTRVLDIHFGDNLEIMAAFPDASFDLIYIDPPFNTGKSQARTQIKTVRDDEGDRVGFAGHRYKTIRIGTKSYGDAFSDYPAFLEPRLVEARRLLSVRGSLFVHLDYREVHYVKVLLDTIFGRANFVNEIIWAYDYGARAKKKWPAKHDNILVYVKDPENYTFNNEAVDREPYMAPGLVTPEKAAKGKLPTDVWWHTIVSPTGKEKTGYATQKPEGILRRVIHASSNEGDWVMDFFAGSGTTAAVAHKLGRKFLTIDQNPEAIEVIQKRISEIDLNSSVEYLSFKP